MTPPAASHETPIRRDAEDLAAIFPALMLEAERVAHTVAIGEHGRRRAGSGETFWQHRPYTFGDPVNAIDWRQSARAADRYYVRQNEWETAAAIWIWRDGSRSLDYASGKQTPSKRWRADVLAVAMTILLSEGGERIGLLGRNARPFQGRTAPARFLEALHVDAYRENETAPPKMQLAAGAKILLISDFFTAPGEIEEACAYYAAQGVDGGLLQIVDPAEEDFPFRGRTEFQDLESNDRLIFGDAGSIAEAYRHKFTAHRERLETLARRVGWPILTHRTDRPAQTALLSLYTAFSNQRAHQS